MDGEEVFVGIILSGDLFLSHLKHANDLEDQWHAAWTYPLRSKLAELADRVTVHFTERSLVPAETHGQQVVSLSEVL